jgi:hypothetical protein
VTKRRLHAFPFWERNGLLAICTRQIGHAGDLKPCRDMLLANCKDIRGLDHPKQRALGPQEPGSAAPARAAGDKGRTGNSGVPIRNSTLPEAVINLVLATGMLQPPRGLTWVCFDVKAPSCRASRACTKTSRWLLPDQFPFTFHQPEKPDSSSTSLVQPRIMRDFRWIA